MVKCLLACGKPKLVLAPFFKKRDAAKRRGEIETGSRKGIQSRVGAVHSPFQSVDLYGEAKRPHSNLTLRSKCSGQLLITDPPAGDVSTQVLCTGPFCMPYLRGLTVS